MKASEQHIAYSSVAKENEIQTASFVKSTFIDQISASPSSSPIKCILTLTRCCTQDCEFCSVDAIIPSSASNCLNECAENATKEQECGHELNPDQWKQVIDNLLLIDDTMEFDLSGGDCLALPWVRNAFIPYLLNKVGDSQRVSITATAVSLKAWLEEIKLNDIATLPGNIHITYDGYRPYSYENLALVQPLKALGIDVHAECPLTVDNCSQEVIESIYSTMLKYQISEILLMRFFPVGRGATPGIINPWEPTAEQYKAAIATFQYLSEKHPKGPKVKLQCALKEYTPLSNGKTLCKMGKSTWCIMPNGDVLICPWAYAMNGNALDSSFVAGNALYAYEDIVSTSSSLIKTQYQDAPGKCKILEFGKNHGTQSTLHHIEEKLLSTGAEHV